jgi:hypothetical protein
VIIRDSVIFIRGLIKSSDLEVTSASWSSREKGLPMLPESFWNVSKTELSGRPPRFKNRLAVKLRRMRIEMESMSHSRWRTWGHSTWT